MRVSARRRAAFEAAGQLTLPFSATLRPLPEHAGETGLFGDAVIRLRVELHWSLPELAERSGIYWRRLSSIEKGLRPRMDEVEALGWALGVDPRDLEELRPGRRLARTRPVTRCALRKAVPPGHPGSRTWDVLTYDEDGHARAAVAYAMARGEGLTPQEIAACTGWSVRVVQRALVTAMEKVRTRMREEVVD